MISIPMYISEFGSFQCEIIKKQKNLWKIKFHNDTPTPPDLKNQKCESTYAWVSPTNIEYIYTDNID